MTGQASSEALERASEKLLHRTQKELKRLDSTSTSGPTERVGGWTRLGAAVEMLLQTVTEWVCEQESRDLADEIRGAVRVAKDPSRVTAGEWLAVLRGVARVRAARHARAKVLADDAIARPSVLARAISLRNVAAHEATEPAREEAIRTLRGLEQLVLRYRRANGWS